MKRTSKKPAKKRRRKALKKSRGKNRAANFAGAFALEVLGMALLLTLFFAFRESPDEYNARMANDSNKPQVETVRPNDHFESYVVGLFEQKHTHR